MTRLLLPFVTAAATWDAWYWYFARIRSAPEEGAALALAAVFLLALGLARGPASGEDRTFPLGVLTVALAAYASSYALLPAIMRAAIAIGATLYSLHYALFRERPPVAFWGMVALAMPVLPSLQFVGGYPMRVLSASLTSMLLNVQGLGTSRQGTMLIWRGRFVEFDAPCSGINMLWVGTLLALMASILFRLDALRTALAIISALAATIIANVLRGASLFYMEAEVIAGLPRWWHDAIGMAAFFAVSAAALACVHRLVPRESPP